MLQAYLMRPTSCVERLTFKRLNSRYIWQSWVRKNANAGDEEPRRVAPSLLVWDSPSIGLEPGTFDFGAELNVFSQVELIADVVDVALGLRLWSEVLCMAISECVCLHVVPYFAPVQSLSR